MERKVYLSIVLEIRKLNGKIGSLTRTHAHAGFVWWKGLELTTSTKSAMLQTMTDERDRLMNQLKPI